nr:M24 family metallopeptidase [Haloplanus ruber]
MRPRRHRYPNRSPEAVADAAEVEHRLSTAAAGIRAVAGRLDAATAVDGRLHADDTPLTAAALTAAADAAVTDAGGAGVDLSVTPDTLRAGEPVVVALHPRDDGVAAPWARTFVVDGGGGWERRAAVAVEMAHDAVTRVAEPGVPVRRIVDEAVAELGAYGLAPTEDPVARTAAGDPLDRSDDASLATGQVFALDPTAVDPDPAADRGRVRIGRYYAVTESGCRALASLPMSLSPGAY